uniref:Uncharacterized protein n=1 Tax=Ascaris lumbricoides TaxID=6252 RepID=A0A9J2Q435_ASCLU
MVTMAGRLLAIVFLLLLAMAVGHATVNYTRDPRDQSTLVRRATAEIRLRSSASPMPSASEVDDLSKHAGDHGRSIPSDLECDGAPSGKLNFCYWAIETGTAEMVLYSNRRSSALIERNIKPFCEPPESDEGVHGITFVDKRIAKKYVDGGNSLMNNQRVLTDVFYFCCSTAKGCANRNQLSLYEAIDMLADDLLEFALTYISKEDGNAMKENLMPKKEPLTCILPDGKSTMIPGTRMCVFMMDANSTTKIYSGPPIFNYFDMEQQSRLFEHQSFAATMLRGSVCEPTRHSNGDTIDSDRCYKYISNAAYLLICCCYKEPRKCALSSDNRAYFNARSWASMLAHQSKMANLSLNPDENDFFNWTKMSYVLATPLVSQKSGFTGRIQDDTKFADTISSRVRYIHCAQGDFVVIGVGADRGVNYTLWRHELAPVAKAVATVGTGTSDLCDHGNKCILTGPQCFNDLINNHSVSAMFTCCCEGEHLCNHKGRDVGPGQALINRSSVDSSCASGAVSLIIAGLNMGHDTKMLCARAFTVIDADELFYFDGITHYSLTPVGPDTVQALSEDPSKDGECMRIIEFPKRDQLCDGKQRDTLLPVQFIRCMCIANGSAHCDKDFQKKTAEILKNAESELPLCMGRSTTIDILIDGGVIYETKEIPTMTTHWPICENTIKLVHEKLQFVIRSGPYLNSSSEHKRFSIAWNVASRKCFAKPGQPPCNGEEALLRHVSYYMKYFASQRKMKQNSQCPGDKTDKPKPCNTRAGCFNFRALDGSLLKQGCMDQIDEIIQRDQKLEFLGFCKSRTVHAELERRREKKGAYYCTGVTHNIASWDVKEGLLCCCPHECPNSTLTFFPFRGIGSQYLHETGQKYDFFMSVLGIADSIFS